VASLTVTLPVLGNMLIGTDFAVQLALIHPLLQRLSLFIQALRAPFYCVTILAALPQTKFFIGTGTVKAVVLYL